MLMVDVVSSKKSDAILIHVGVARPLIKLMGNEHREDAVGVGELAMRHTHTRTHTHSVPRDTQDGCRLGQGSDTFLTHVGVAPTNQINGLRTSGGRSGGVGSKQWQTHTHTVSLVILRVDVVSSKDRTQSWHM